MSNQQSRVASQRAAILAKREGREGKTPIFDVTVGDKRYRVFSSEITWFHEQALDEATRGTQRVGLTPRKIANRLHGEDYSQVVLAGVVFLSRLQNLTGDESVSFAEVADEVGSGYDPDNVIIGAPESEVADGDDAEGDGPGEAHGDDS